MEYNYELININEDLPLNIFLHKVKYVANHWHDHIEILFVLKGKVDVRIYDKQFTLRQEDLLLININEIHSIQADEDNLLLALQIPISFIKGQYKDIEPMTFECKSFMYAGDEQERFNRVRSLLAELMLVHSKGTFGAEISIKIKALLLGLIYLLVSNFSYNSEASRISNKYMQRLLRITNYMKDNYTKELGLKDIADLEELSVPHVSNFFQKYMGMSFSKYLSQIRMEHSVKEILLTDLPITQIAMNQGFPNLKSFHKLFKEIFNTTPAQYRKGLLEKPKKPGKIDNSIPKYLDYNRENAYEGLFKYLRQSLNEAAYITEADSRKTQTVNIEMPEHCKELAHSWRKLCSIGKAKEGLYVEVQRHLKAIQERIGFRYVRFHGIFDDEMMVYHEDEAGQPCLNFAYVDQLFDFLLNIGLRPFVELGFMPSDLAGGAEKIFYKTSNISMPKDIQRWKLLVRSLVVHCITRYGLEEVKTWYLEIWNEPDTIAFWRGNFEEYCRFYLDSYQTIKAVCFDIKVGGPGITFDSLWKNDFLERFIGYCQEQQCLPDFLTFHSYPGGLEDMLQQLDSSAVELKENSETYLSDAVQLVNDKIEQLKIAQTEIHVTEWNSTPSHRDLVNDTCFKAAYIARNINDNLDRVASLCYWTGTDLLEELPLARDTFHGGLGLITYNGIKKPGFYAYELLAKLGERLVSKGPGYCLTKTRDKYQLLVYNYCHINKLYSMNDLLGIDAVKRYHVFAATGQLEMNFNITGIAAGDYTIRSYTINREHGSAFDLWLELGAPQSLTTADIEYLNTKGVPKQVVRQEEIEKSWNITCDLGPHEVRLLELSPVYS